MPRATLTRALPKTCPATVGIREKKAPAAGPLSTTKAINGPSVVDTGQRASMLNPFRKSELASVFRGPIWSLRNPAPILPTADERLNAATSAAAVLVDRPRELLYSGKKNGGTKSGKVATAPAN